MPLFEVGIPPSVNHMYQRDLRFSKKGKPYRGIRLTDEARTFRDELLLQAIQWRAANPKQCFVAPYKLHIALRLRDAGAFDEDNGVKIIQDTLAKAFEKDDKWVFELVVHKRIHPALEPKCWVEFDHFEEIA